MEPAALQPRPLAPPAVLVSLPLLAPLLPRALNDFASNCSLRPGRKRLSGYERQIAIQLQGRLYAVV